MMVHELVKELQEHAIQLYTKDSRLRYRARPGALTPELRCAIEVHKKEILGYLLRHPIGNYPAIVPITRDASLPLSHAQQRLWFLDQLEPGGAVYHIPGALRLVGYLDIDAFERGINEIVRRHEVLRTTFAMVEGRGVQVIAPELELSIPILDLSRVPRGHREAEVRRLASEEAQRPFDLAVGPLLRVSLLDLGDDAESGVPAHVVLFTLHHIVSDGWSMDVLVREFVALYEAFSHGRPSPLPELPIQYADYAVWQRQWLQGEVLERQLSYWKEQLSGAPEVLTLPTDRPRPAVQSYRGASYAFALSPVLTAQLHALSRREGVTLFMTLLAAFQILLSRYSGQRDICVGSPTANRNRVEIEGLIGFFVNTLVLRTDLSGNPSFIELLTRVREVCLGAQAHQDLPFEKLVEELQPVRDMSHSPLFQVMLVLQNTPSRELELPGLHIHGVEAEIETATFDLALAMTEEPGGLQGSIEYATDLFEAVAIARLAEHFQVLLEGIAARPGARLSELPMLTEPERQQLLIEWNATRTDYPKDRCIHELFEAQVEHSPDATAVVYEEQSLRYRELNAKANQLAHHLRALGVGPDTLVGICVERSLEMVIGLLGILKAGGAYLPLDPEYPKERLAYMLADARPSVLLTQARLREVLPEHPEVFCLDSDWPSIARRSKKDPPHYTSPLNLAYVIYTSGSTGRPKGVLTAHCALSNHCAAIASHYGLEGSDRILQFASLSFDLAAEELFPSVCRGAAVVLRPEEVSASFQEFVRLIEHEGITVLNLPASYWTEWVADMLRTRTSVPASLRMVIIGSDKVSAEALRQWRKLAGEAIAWRNAYGPTETTITSVLYAPAPGKRVPGGVVPIGRPISNTRVYVLDEALEPVPIGAPGELYIGGAGLARGYLNRPDLTAERFLPNPFVEQSEGRLYRTGDRVRWGSDGDLECLGRVDHQVKVRGFRIELGEIEEQLKQHPGVRDAVVTVRENASAPSGLIAYVVADSPIEIWPSVGEYLLYDEFLYGTMTHDVQRNARYDAAIQRLVKDKIVLDLGTGKDALLARLCAKAGAKRVYAIEGLESAWREAQACVVAERLQDTIQVIHGWSTSVQLPELVDVCVSELIGMIGGSEGAGVILQDAYRFLKPDGVMIPQGCVTQVAAVSLPDVVIRQPVFAEAARPYVAQVFNALGAPYDFRVCLTRVPPGSILSDPATFEALEFGSEVQTTFERRINLTISRPGCLDGFVLWIILTVSEGEVLDSLRDRTNWLPVYLPVFQS